MVNKNASVSVSETMPPNESWSPAEKVASCKDLMTEILVILSVKSVFRYKCVSKQWYSLISDPSFKLLHSPKPAGPPSGMFVPREIRYPKYEFVPFDVKNPVKVPFRVRVNFDPNPKGIRIHHSCNGLILCSGSSVNPIRDVLTRYFYVYNPTFNKFTTLPPLDISFHTNIPHYGVTLAFDPSTSPHYKIIFVSYVGTTPNYSIFFRYKIQIYSSQTRTFNPSRIQCSVTKPMYFGGGVYWNNVIHWIHPTGLLLCLNLDQEIVHQIEIPFSPLSADDDMMFSKDIFESRNHLLVVEAINRHTCSLKIHELNRDYSGWSVKYHVGLHSFPSSKFGVVSIVLGEKEDDSFLVLKGHWEVARFNLVSKTFETLCDSTLLGYVDSEFPCVILQESLDSF